MARRVLSFNFCDGEQEALIAIGKTVGPGTSWAEAERRVLSTFAFGELQTANVAITAFFNPATDRSVLDLFADYRRAVRGDDGWRLAKIPPGGHWEGKGLAGKLYPLHETQKFTINGIETYTGSRPLPVNFLRDDWEPGH